MRPTGAAHRARIALSLPGEGVRRPGNGLSHQHLSPCLSPAVAKAVRGAGARVVGSTHLIRAFELGKTFRGLPWKLNAAARAAPFPLPLPKAGRRSHPHLALMPRDPAAAASLVVHCWTPHFEASPDPTAAPGPLSALLVRTALANGVPLYARSYDWRPASPLSGTEAEFFRMLSTLELAELLPDETVMVDVDTCAGTAVLAGVEDILEKFHAFDADMVLSAEVKCKA